MSPTRNSRPLERRGLSSSLASCGAPREGLEGDRQPSGRPPGLLRGETSAEELPGVRGDSIAASGRGPPAPGGPPDRDLARVAGARMV
mmetsp:Transcript_62500/g.183226  ORF Transcript_62500/g.183226 Transcript_62500/m.183226 type:complete len:88 (+) Transcript_62500:214-477(+)